MQREMVVRFSKIVILTVVLSFHMCPYAIVAYIPQALRDCVSSVYETAKKTDNVNNLAELYSMIGENRILTSETMVRKAVEEALHILESNTKTVLNNNQKRLIKSYLREYSNSLDNTFELLAMHGDEAQRTSWPTSLVTRSLDGISVDKDMMCLSSELTTVKSMQLCGTAAIDFSSLKRPGLGNLSDPGIVFNANAMTNSIYTTPNVIFGTGVSSPSINAWSIAPSSSVQSPINMQFSIPGMIKERKLILLELHFLVKQAFASIGDACIRIEIKSMNLGDDFDIMDPSPVFTHTIDSDDFLITEPSSSDSLKHIGVFIPIEKSKIEPYDFVLLSVTRIAPTSGIEYGQDIYLAASAFRYTCQKY